MRPRASLSTRASLYKECAMPTITLQETSLPDMADPRYAYYDRWIESLELPIYKGYYVEDLRTIKLDRWDERGCDAAFLQLAGQQGVTGCYVTEVAPGATTPPFKMAVDECVYVLEGRGITTVQGQDGSVASRERSSIEVAATSPASASTLPAGAT